MKSGGEGHGRGEGLGQKKLFYCKLLWKVSMSSITYFLSAVRGGTGSDTVFPSAPVCRQVSVYIGGKRSPCGSCCQEDLVAAWGK